MMEYSYSILSSYSILRILENFMEKSRTWVKWLGIWMKLVF